MHILSCENVSAKLKTELIAGDVLLQNGWVRWVKLHLESEVPLTACQTEKYDIFCSMINKNIKTCALTIIEQWSLYMQHEL